MSLMKSLTLAFVLCLVTLCCVSSTNAQGQSNKSAGAVQGDRDQTLQQLLTEVRELRLAVQRATVSNTRFQMLIERVRVQQVRVDALSRQLESIHSQVADMKAAKPQMEQQIKEAEDLLDRTPDSNAHADLESRIKVGKASVSRLTQEDEPQPRNRRRYRVAGSTSEAQRTKQPVGFVDERAEGAMTM
jgi:cell division protein FtsB